MGIWSAYRVIRTAKRVFRQLLSAYPATQIFSFQIMPVIVTIAPMDNMINRGSAKIAIKRSAQIVFIVILTARLAQARNTYMRVNVRRIVRTHFMGPKSGEF